MSDNMFNSIHYNELMEQETYLRLMGDTLISSEIIFSGHKSFKIKSEQHKSLIIGRKGTILHPIFLFPKSIKEQMNEVKQGNPLYSALQYDLKTISKFECEDKRVLSDTIKRAINHHNNVFIFFPIPLIETEITQSNINLDNDIHFKDFKKM